MTDILLLLVAVIIGNVGGFLIGLDIGKNRGFSKGYDAGQRKGIEWMIKYDSGIYERENNERHLQIAMKNWP